MRLLAVLLAVLVVPLAGCSISTDDHATEPERTEREADASTDLEAVIFRQLPGRVRRLAGPGAFVTDVHCIHRAASGYECIASVSGTNAYSGAPERTQLPIAGTCDQRSCIWKVSP